ncbi:unnamed protein product [Nezara viridula]|uniref:Uncharacterized protein n=1 Tax=Nezara viridula TaxID=85310 RepID=A0A9P0H2V5_NEZVI|nr:unnamed protein product [Nezara viridula]
MKGASNASVISEGSGELSVCGRSHSKKIKSLTLTTCRAFLFTEVFDLQSWMDQFFTMVSRFSCLED